jgi:hypothetical protein
MGKMKLHHEILNGKRSSIVDRLIRFGDRFYLAGGTGLALQLGHRISEDFDFFTYTSFNNDSLFGEIKDLFPEFLLNVMQNEKDTFTVLLNDEIKISFFRLRYTNILPLLEAGNFKLAQIQEIGVMKLVALPRAVYKDYVDIYFILKEFSLLSLMDLAKLKHPEFNQSVYLKCLLSYEDVDLSPVIFTSGKAVTENEVFSFIEKQTLEFLKNTSED